MENDFNRHCERCFACLQWRPQRAIHYRGAVTSEAQNHHPEIQGKDMILR
jgi:hypothetical protein